MIGLRPRGGGYCIICLSEIGLSVSLKYVHNLKLFHKVLNKIIYYLDSRQNEIYIIKQDIRIYVAYSRPNGWTDWAELLLNTHGWPGGVKFLHLNDCE